MIAPLYLGVDGGGTKTQFVCIDAHGAVVAQATLGTTYHVQIGADETVARLIAGVAAICRDLAITPGELAFAFFGLPGYGEDPVIDPRLDVACATLLGHARYACGNDMICGWAGSLGGADGINLVAGTGSIGYGERGGIGARVGGWGESFSDEGSAYWIAIRGLNAFTRMSDGRLPRTPLHAAFRATLALETDLDLCARMLGAAAMPRDEVATLARVVSQAARDGDDTAAAILEKAGAALAAMAVALRATLRFAEDEKVPLSWSGGVLSGEALVRNALTARLASIGGFAPVAPLHGPGRGAALYAKLLASRSVVARHEKRRTADG